MHTLGPVSFAAAQLCPRVEVDSFLRLSPDQAERVGGGESQHQKRDQPRAEDVSRERPPLLESVIPPPSPRGVALPKLADILCLSRLGRQLFGRGVHLDSDVFALPRRAALSCAWTPGQLQLLSTALGCSLAPDRAPPLAARSVS